MQTILASIFDVANSFDASDIHIASEETIALRVNGKIIFLKEHEKISKQTVYEILNFLLPDQNLLFANKKEIDFSYSHDGERYRCNAYHKKGKLCLSIRKVKNDIPSLEKIGLPENIKDVLKSKQGLILIAGPAGSGKSTTMASMINWLNENTSNHIITLENPIEYQIENKNCLITQREICTDTDSFENSLRSVLRQDPNVIAIGEARDKETIESMLKLSLTGHLVFCTIHSHNTVQSIQRIISTFPFDQQKVILSQLAESLLAIISQQLIPSTDQGRIATFELMIANSATKNAIRNGDMMQLENTLATSNHEGMINFQNHLRFLKATGKVAFDFNLA